jgi:hypothetical protein
VTVLRLPEGPLPTDGPSLAEALAGGFAALLEEGSDPPAVEVREASWPGLEALRVDLTGVRVRAGPGAEPPSDEPGEAGFVAAAVEVVGRPVGIGGTATTLDVSLEDAAFAWPREGGRFLGLVRHGGGRLDLFVDREEIRRRVEAGLVAKLAGQGMKVLGVDVELESAGENRVGVTLLVTVRAIFKAKLRVTAELSLGPDLALLVTKGELTGENMGGKTLAGLARPQLEKLVGQTFELGALLPPGIDLEDVRLRTEDGLGVAAGIPARPE